MKIKFINEKFITPQQKEYHFRKHVTADGFSTNSYTGRKEYEFTYYEYPTADDYDEGADRFARSDIRNPEIVGFVTTDGRFHKHNLYTGEFTAYFVKDGEPYNVTYHLFTPEENGNRWKREVARFKRGDNGVYYDHAITYEEDAK